MHTTINPPGWAPAIGYANGMVASGRTLYLGGQIGWNAEQLFESVDLVDQFRQTLENIVTIVEAAGGRPEHLVSMTWFMTDLDDYQSCLKDIGRAYRSIIGKHFPAMAVVEVSRLVEPRAKIEIQAIAVLPD